MKKRLQIEIPNPCHADWNSMTPNKNGRHCNSCNKTVVDFTTMTTEEIKTYFIKNADKKTCGHFYKGQLKNDKNKFQTAIFNLYCDAYVNLKNKAVRLAALLILGGFLSLTGCNTPTKDEVIENHERLTGDTIAPIQVDTLTADTTKNGL